MRLIMTLGILLSTLNMACMESIDDLKTRGFSAEIQRKAHLLIEFNKQNVFNTETVWLKDISPEEKLKYLNKGYNLYTFVDPEKSHLIKQLFLVKSIVDRQLYMNHHQIYVKKSDEEHLQLLYEIELEPQTVDDIEDAQAIIWPRRFWGLEPNEQNTQCIVGEVDIIKEDTNYLERSLVLIDLPK